MALTTNIHDTHDRSKNTLWSAPNKASVSSREDSPQVGLKSRRCHETPGGDSQRPPAIELLQPIR